MPKFSLLMSALLALLLAGGVESQESDHHGHPEHTAHKNNPYAQSRRPASAHGGQAHRAVRPRAAAPRPRPVHRATPRVAARRHNAPPRRIVRQPRPVRRVVRNVRPIRMAPRPVHRTNPRHRSPARPSGRSVTFTGRVLRIRGSTFAVGAAPRVYRVNAAHTRIRYRGRFAGMRVLRLRQTVTVSGILQGSMVRATAIVIR